LRRREREKSWQDEVRDRVRKRKRKRSGEPELPLFEAPADLAPPSARAPEIPVAPAAPLEEQPVAAVVRVLPPSREERPGAFEGRILDPALPPESLVDLPLRASDPAPSSRELSTERSLAAAESPEAEEKAEASGEDDWRIGSPLEPQLEAPAPSLGEDRPVERPAQALERAQAAAVDLLLLGLLSAVVVYFASRFAHVPIEGLRPSWPYLGGYLAFLALVYAVYFTGTTGQTLGKLVFGLRVVDTGGRPPGYLRAAGRAAFGTLGVLALGLGLVPVLFDPARRAFHDRVLHTRVIRG
jgi:uncharacterized RDD family membrane protein YckC